MSKNKWSELIDPEFTRVAGAIFDGSFTGDVDKEMVKLVAGRLHRSADGAMKEFYKGTDNVYSQELAGKLERDAYKFAAAKNYKQLAFLKSLKDSSASKEAFMDQALKQNKKFNHLWLQTEEYYAQGAAQSAARWDSFDPESWLKYRTSNDERVRNEHRQLNGIVKPITDPFWNVYYPPNGYNCRCLAIETTSRQETDMNYRKVPEMPPFFQNNVGKQQVLFPGNHPYYKGVPEGLAKSSDKLFRSDIIDRSIGKYAMVVLNQKEIPFKITVTGSSIKKIANQPHDNYWEKLSLLTDLNEVISKSILIKTSDPFEWKPNPMVEKYYYTVFERNGKKFYLNFRKMKNNEVVLYSITDNMK